MAGRWQLWGREVHPLALGSTVALAGVAIGPFYGNGNTVFEFDSVQGVVMAIVAALTAALFVAAWVDRAHRTRLIRPAFLLTAGVFFSRAVLGALTVGPSHPAVWINTGIVVTAVGAWTLERAQPRGRHE